jgi:hypothetical protein
MDLTLDRAKSGEQWQRPFGNIGSIELIQSHPNSPYHMSLMTAIWSKKHLLKMLHPGWSPWNLEMEGTTVLGKHPELKVIGTTARIVPHTLAFRGGNDSKLLLDELKPEDVDELRELGLLSPWEKEKENA